MKEIEFKGQPIGKRERWQYGIGAYKTNTAEHLIINAKGDSVEVIHLCQYTGLDDSKGKHIYEGDILFVQVLSANSYFKYNTDVIFEDGVFCIKGENSNDYDTLLYAYINPTSPLVELEVVGNVFSNPELLSDESKK